MISSKYNFGYKPVSIRTIGADMNSNGYAKYMEPAHA